MNEPSVSTTSVSKPRKSGRVNLAHSRPRRPNREGWDGRWEPEPAGDARERGSGSQCGQPQARRGGGTLSLVSIDDDVAHENPQAPIGDASVVLVKVAQNQVQQVGDDVVQARQRRCVQQPCHTTEQIAEQAPGPDARRCRGRPRPGEPADPTD